MVILFLYQKYFYNDVIICRYTLLRMRDFTASATALTHLVWLRAGGDNRKHARSGHRTEGRSPGRRPAPLRVGRPHGLAATPLHTRSLL